MLYKDRLKKIYEKALVVHKYDESHIPNEIKTVFEEAVNKGSKAIIIPFDEFNNLRLKYNDLDYILLTNGIKIVAIAEGMQLSVDF